MGDVSSDALVATLQKHYLVMLTTKCNCNSYTKVEFSAGLKVGKLI